MNSKIKNVRRARSLDSLAGRAGGMMEMLEQRQLMTAVTWDGDAGDNLWTSQNNWSNNLVPTGADDVTIDVAANPTIRLTNGARVVNSLFSRETIQFEGGSLTVNTTAQYDAGAVLRLQGGTLIGGTYSFTAAAAVATSSSGGTLNNVTLGTELLMNTNSAFVAVQGTTTFTAARLQASGAGLYGAPGYVLNNLVVAEGGATGTRTVTMGYGGNGTFTIGPSGVVRLAAGVGGGLNFNNSSVSTLVNNGLITNESAQTLLIQNSTLTNNAVMQGSSGAMTISPTNWSNTATGSIAATGGSTLRFQGAWTDAGLININASTLSLEGTFATASFNFAGFTRTAGTVNLVGTMTNTAGVLPLTAATGSWQMGGGTIVGGSVTYAGGSSLLFNSNGGTLTNVAVGGELILNTNNAFVVGGGTTTFTAARLQASGAGFYMAPGFQLSNLIVAEGAATGTRTVTMAYGGNGTVTVLAAGVIRLAAGSGGGLSFNNSSVSTLVNNGLITNESSQTLLIQNSTFTNNAAFSSTGTGTTNISPTNWSNGAAGAISVSGGGIMRFQGTWTNAGTVNVDASTLHLEGAFSTANFNFPGFTRTGGTVNLAATVTNTGNTITLNAATGSWNFTGGIINNGSLTSVGGSTLVATTSGGTLNSVAVTGELILQTTSSYMIIAGTTSFTAARLQGNNTGLYFAPGTTLNSLISVEGAATGNRVIQAGYGGAGSLTIGATGIVRVAAGAGGGLNISNSSVSTVINNGLISAEAAGQILAINNSTFTNNATGTAQALAGTLRINATTYTNAGTFKVATGATLDLDGGFNAAGGTGTLVNTGTGVTWITGTITNTGNTITLNAGTGPWTMHGGVINNGSMVLSGGISLLTTASGGTLNSLAITGEVLLSITSSYVILGGNTSFTAARLQANNASIYMAPGTSMDSLISVEGAAAGTRVIILAYGGVGTVTFGPNAIVRLASGAGGGLTIQNSSVATLNNNGLISNEATGQTLAINNSTFNNNATGTVQALAGTVTINATTYTNLGTFKVATGAVLTLDGGFNVSAGLGSLINTGTGITRIAGTITNTGNTITLNATTGSWTMYGGSIVNGSLNLTAGTQLLTTTSGGTINNVAIAGEIIVNVTSAYIVLAGSPTFTALRLQANNANVYLIPGTTVNSLIVVEGAVAGNRSMIVGYGGVGNATFGPSAIVRLAAGAGAGFTIQNSSAGTVINNGLFTAEAAGQTMQFNNSVLTNNPGGIVQALAGAMVVNNTSYTNAGTFSVANGAVLTLDGGFNVAGGIGTFTNAGTGITRVAGIITNTGNTITLNATTGSWTMYGGSIVNGSLNLTAGTQLFTTASGGTINNVAIAGEIIVNVTSAYIVLAGSPTFTALRLQANNANVYLVPGVVINSLIVVEGAAAGTRTMIVGYGGVGTATFGPSAIVRLAAGAGAGFTIQNSSVGTVINNGLITSEATGQTLAINNSVLTNNATGIIQALAGLVNINNTTYTNAGTFKVSNGATLGLDGNMDATTASGIGTLINAGTGVTRVAGNITNTAKTIVLNASTGSLTMFGGSIVNGALTATGGTAILGSNSGGTLNNLAVTGELLNTATSAYTILAGTTTFTAARLQGNNTALYLTPGYTLNNLVSIEGAAAGNRVMILGYGGVGTNTFSASAVVRIAAGAGSGLTIQNSSVATLINNGLIEGLQSGTSLAINNSFFTNNGTLNAAGPATSISAAISNISAGTLSGGVWKASNGGSLSGSANLVKVLSANVTLDGASAGWNALAKLETISPGTTFTLGTLTDQNVAPATNVFTNSGTLIIGLGSRVAVTGNFVQTAGALIRFLIAGGNANTNYGSLTATGTGSLAGTLEIVAVNGYDPTRPHVQDVIKTTGSTTGTFSSATWPQTTNPEWKTYFYYTGNGVQLITTSIIDFNVDGEIDLVDYFEFFNRWDLQDPTLDLNNDGSVDLGDYFLFFNLFDQG